MKQLDSQIVIYKLDASLLETENWDLTIDYETARRNDRVATQGDASQLFDMCEEYIPAIKIEVPKKNSNVNTEYRFTDAVIGFTFKSNKEFDECCKKAKVNGYRYKRFVGTTGGVKNDTVLFVREDIYDDLERRANNDRDFEKKMVVAKFEAYKALMCSNSHKVTMPKGVVVIKDCITHFKEKVIYVDDTSGLPVVEERDNFDIELNASDGFGMARLEIFEMWSRELEEDYIISGCCLRDFSLKGMCYPFEFEELANQYGIDEITDVWGNKHKIKDINLVLTEGMLKLWDSYKSIEHYLECCERNGFSLRINKTVPKELKDTRELNYQFIQSFELSDDDIVELATPTISNIKKALCGDYNATLEFLGANDKTNIGDNINCIDALLTSEKMMNDPYVKRSVYGMIKKKIDGVKIGKLECEGDFQLASGDPYALTQSMLGVEVTGLLQADEVYTDYWDLRDCDEVLLFRAPMTSHNNIRKARVRRKDDARYWYRHMKNIIILNCHDSIMMAENGEDFDGDTNFVTNNKVLLRNHRKLPVIICVQNKATKETITESKLAQSNKNGFSFARGEVVGTVTNRITSQIEVQARFDKGSEEWLELEKRIICGQLYQQNSIDKLKGVKCTPMPKKWYNWKACKTDFDKRIVADKKPYFMMYIYPAEKSSYDKYIKEYNTKSRIQFRITLDELLKLEERTEEQQEFVYWFNEKMPLGMSNCVMNRICRYVEEQFKDLNFEINNDGDFDYNILRSNIGYSESLFKKVKKLYEQYTSEVREYSKRTKVERIDSYNNTKQRQLFINHFRTQAENICSNKEKLCNIVLDICYTKETSKGFAWEICKPQILENLRRNESCMN